MSGVTAPVGYTGNTGVNTIDRPGGTGSTGNSQAFRTSDAPPPAPGMEGRAGDIPGLAPPDGFDASELLNAFLALKTKIDNEAQTDSIKEVQAQGVERKAKNDEVAAKMQEAIDKMAESKAGQIAMKVFGWIAVALTVIAAVVTGGALAIAAAAIAVTMAVLMETGAMDKMTEMIAESLQKDMGMSESEAKKAAGWIMISIQVALALVTLGAGAANATSTAAQSASKVAQMMQMSAKTAQTVGNVATGVGAGATIAQSSVGIASGVQRFEAAEAQAEVADIKKFLAKLIQQQEDETARLQQMAQEMSAGVSRAMQIINGQAESLSGTIHRMG